MVTFQNPVNKNDYLGEYTGELISHREADKRGKIYDRANSSFLFDLNDQACVSLSQHGLLFSLNIGYSGFSQIAVSFLVIYKCVIIY